MWTNTGTITVTTGSRIVEGQGTQFVGPVSAGYALLTGDLRLYEIEAVESATRLRLVRAYQGGGAANVPYDVVPVGPDVTGLIERIQALIDRYQSFRDTIGQGMFGDGSAVMPGMRYIADQDTGIRRVADNTLALVTGGVDGLTVAPSGNVGVGQPFPAGARLDVAAAGSALLRLFNSAAAGTRLMFADTQYAAEIEHNGGSLRFKYNGASEGFRLQDGNLLVGITSAPEHTITKGAGQGSAVLRVRSNASGALDSFVVASVSAYSPNGAGAAVYLGHSTATSRSLNASGTVNASGADYAEYMVKAGGCGLIAKGDVCGVDHEGKLTKAWADAISFVVKSTDPSLVGGDTWAAHLPPRPDAPGPEPQPPALPTVPAEDVEDAELATYREALAAYPALVAQYRVDHDAWAAATAAYERDLPAWEADLEAARQCVDRIAFCGQVPCNVTGDFEVGDYIVAAANGGGIKAVAMKLDDMTLAQYARRIGKVWAIRDGRAWIDVQHG
jgi:hypothetical protein